MNNNPFMLTFGMKPENYISRIGQLHEIINSFETGTNNVFMITGVRGTGKTVMLSHISEYLPSKKIGWLLN